MDIIYSAYQSENTDVLTKILGLYAAPGAIIIDFTFNKGTFWRRVPKGLYTLISNDLHLHDHAEYHEDFRNTGFDSETFDVVVFDPPYAVKKAGRVKSNIAMAVQAGYGVFDAKEISGMTDEENVQLYLDGFKEAHRVLRHKGILITKVQDGGSSARYWKMPKLVFVDGWVCEDMFVVVQKGLPPWDPKWKKQHHARKNHSYFLVHRKV